MLKAIKVLFKGWAFSTYKQYNLQLFAEEKNRRPLKKRKKPKGARCFKHK